MKICIVIPAYNEAAAIGQVITDYRSQFPDATFVVIDNNSDDDTSKIAKQHLQSGDHLLFEERQGKGEAVRSGLSRTEADVYILTDGDDTYSASDARRAYDLLITKRCDMVVGDRVTGGGYAQQNTRIGHSWGNRILTRYISFLAGTQYSDVLSGLRIMSAPFVSLLSIRSSGFQLETELNIVASYARAKTIELPISYGNRPEGSESKLSTLRDGIRICRFAFLNWVSFFPLQFLVFWRSWDSVYPLCWATL